MENQLHTQENLNNEKESLNKKFENFGNSIKNNLNYIYIVLMLIANALFSILRVENGKIGLQYPNSELGWVLWLTQIFIATIIGVVIMNCFRRQGIKYGLQNIKDIYDKYLKLISKDTQSKPRSLKKYMSSQIIKDGLIKGTLFAIINIFVVSVIISANWNSLLSIFTTVIFAVGFGIKTMLDAEDFVITELVIWYQIKINEIEEEVKNEQRLQCRNEQSRVRSTKTSRVQQKKKCRTGQSTKKPE